MNEHITSITVVGVNPMTIDQYWDKVNKANTMKKLTDVESLIRMSDQIDIEDFEELMEAISEKMKGV